jgi:predicted dehydrogenase
MITMAIIGHRGHARRLIDIVDAHDDVKLKAIYHPTNYVIDRRGTSSFDDVVKCDSVIIASPNNTHARYMHALKTVMGYDGYIMCEKPPFIRKEDIDYFRAPDGMTYFNFNFRHSPLAAFVAHNINIIGRPIRMDVHMTHGLAYTPDYGTSWRADMVVHPLGVAETVGVHWIDLAQVFLGNVSTADMTLMLTSHVGTAPDTATIRLQHGVDGIPQTHVFVSYAAPKRFAFSLVGSDGHIEYSHMTEELVACGPRHVNGNFCEPPRHADEPFNIESTYDASLRASMEHFITTCARGEKFSTAEYDLAIRTNEVLLGMRT